MSMRLRNWLWIGVLAIAFLATRPGVARAAEPQETGGAHLVPEKGTAVPYLVVTTPNGRYVIRLFGEDDGPVLLPAEGSQLSGILISAELTAKGARVSIGIEESALRISPFGYYDLALGEKDKPLQDLEALGLKGWSMTFAVGEVTDVIDGCCGCGRINCCPLPGKCLACSRCGQCCSDGPPEV